MFKRFLFSSILLVLATSACFTQSKYWVVFTDKDGVKFDPFSYFDEKTVNKRLKNNIPLVSFSDLPIRSDYLDLIGDSYDVTGKSRWLNAVAVNLTKAQKKEVETYGFVRKVARIGTYSRSCQKNEIEDMDPDIERILDNQLKIMGGHYFSGSGVDGTGVRIAIFDGGFPSVDTLSFFRHIREDNRIIATYDFVKDNDFVYDFNSHGTSVLSCIAGKMKNKNIGLATGAEFLLARTEVSAEIFEEEENWMAAMEWADKHGADIINSSLGYTYHRYFPRQMDGESTFVTRAAEMAARKGILVVNAAGNDGDNSWQVVGAPADADSILSVGGIFDETGIHISFSSLGPTFDGRLKPNVVAHGNVVVAGKKSLKLSYGTSFATPLITGFAACVMQMYPEWDNMKVYQEIQKSGHLYPYYDYAHGYGIPQAAYFFGKERKKKDVIGLSLKDNKLKVQLDISSDSICRGSVSDSLTVLKAYRYNPLELDKDYLYYHYADEKTGKIRRYRLVRMEDNDHYEIDLNDLKENELLRIYFNGQVKTFNR